MNIRPIRRSDIETYRKCPYSYWLRKEAGIEGGNEHTRRGVARHLVFEALANGRNIYATPEEQKAFNRVLPFIRGMKTERTLYINEKGNRAENVQYGFMQITVDSYNEHAMAVDYKTGQSGYATAAYDEDYKFQADYYMTVLAPDLPKKGLYKFVFLFPFQELERDGCPSKSFDYDLEKLPELRESIMEQVRAFEKEALARTGWEPNFNSCPNCLFAERCKHLTAVVQGDTDIVQVETVLTPTTVERAIEVYGLLKAMTERADETLREYVKVNGTITAGNKQYGFYRQGRREINNLPGIAHTIIKSAGEKKSEAQGAIIAEMSLSLSSVERLAKKYGADIARFIETKEIEKFGWLPKKAMK